MGQKDAPRLRIVLDTNTVVSASIFEQGRLAWIRDFWRQSRVVPLTSQPTTEELIRVLSYPKFGLTAREIRTLASDYVTYAEVVVIRESECAGLPQCRDPDDQMFLELAECGRADVLVTGDDDLLACAESVEFDIEPPARFRKRVQLSE